MLKQNIAGVWFTLKEVAHRFHNNAERIATLAPLREVLEPRPCKWQPGFSLAERANISTRLHPKGAKYWGKAGRKVAQSKRRKALRRYK